MSPAQDPQTHLNHGDTAEPGPSGAGAPPAPTARPGRGAIVWVVLLASLIFVAGRQTSDLRVDNLRYAAISKQVLTSENPLLLYLGEELYLNKPPLLFWLTAVSLKLFGVNIFAAKLVSALFGVALVWLVFCSCRRVFGDDRIGCFSAIALVTSQTIYQETDGCRMESMLAFFLLAALVVFVVYLRDGHVRWMLAWGILNGLAVMTKGVAGLAAIPPCLLYLALFDRGNIRAWRHSLVGLLVVMLTCGWWYAYVWRQTDFYDVYIQKQVIDRVLIRDAADPAPIPESPHTTTSERYLRDPWYHFLVLLPAQYFYYLPFCLVGVWSLWRSHRSDPLLRLVALFVVLYFSGLHLLDTKYARYLYPVIALLSIPTAEGARRLIPWRPDRLVAGLAVAAAILLAFYPGPFQRVYYGGLADLNRLAVNSGMPVVFGPELYGRLDGRSAAFFFFDRHQTSPPSSGPYLFINSRPPAAGLAHLLLANKRLRVYLAHQPPEASLGSHARSRSPI